MVFCQFVTNWIKQIKMFVLFSSNEMSLWLFVFDYAARVCVCGFNCYYSVIAVDNYYDVITRFSVIDFLITFTCHQTSLINWRDNWKEQCVFFFKIFFYFTKPTIYKCWILLTMFFPCDHSNHCSSLATLSFDSESNPQP